MYVITFDDPETTFAILCTSKSDTCIFDNIAEAKQVIVTFLSFNNPTVEYSIRNSNYKAVWSYVAKPIPTLEKF